MGHLQEESFITYRYSIIYVFMCGTPWYIMLSTLRCTRVCHTWGRISYRTCTWFSCLPEDDQSRKTHVEYAVKIIVTFNKDAFCWSALCDCWSQWPRFLILGLGASRLQIFRVRIPPGASMFVWWDCCVLSGRGLWDELITRPEESYRMWCVVVCDLETSWMRRPWPTGGGGRGYCHPKETYKQTFCDYLNKGRPTWWHLLYYVNLLLNIFSDVNTSIFRSLWLLGALLCRL